MEQLTGFPKKQGLYHPQNEKDACGIGLVAQIQGLRTHRAVEDALRILCSLDHRGARGADAETGDGAGILTQIPHLFLQAATSGLGFELPELGAYGVGMVFLSPCEEDRKRLQKIIESRLSEQGIRFLGWRSVPVRSESIGAVARKTEPTHWQFFVARDLIEPSAFERKLYFARKRVENAILDAKAKELPGREFFAIPSFSSQTIVYKGMLLPEQLGPYFPDLSDPQYETAIALVHSRFSTNTFPAWPLAHPFRFICHNGEINTLKGNVNWMKARQGRMTVDGDGEDLRSILPIIRDGQSDSASFDNMLEFLVMTGRSLPHSMMMLIPEPWAGAQGAPSNMDPELRGFYEYHASIMEPWDGPAAMVFTDGKQVGAMLDRNGLRPCRYQLTQDGYVILSSEAGVLPIDASRIVDKRRLEPGKMLLIDTVEGRLVEDDELKGRIARQKPYRAWVEHHRVSLNALPEPLNSSLSRHYSMENMNAAPQGRAIAMESLRAQQRVFGYTEEELKMVLPPMGQLGEEPISSMGNDTPLAVLSDRPQLLFRYFKQLFAQVTNPPIDPIREHLVMSLITFMGPKGDILSETAETCRSIRLETPVLTNRDLEKVREIPDPAFQSKTLKMLFAVKQGPDALEKAVENLCREALLAVRVGNRFLILSDRGVDENWAPIPSLLAVSAVHQYLIAQSARTQAGLIVETGEARDVHQISCLIGFGAGSVNPYLAFDSLSELARAGALGEWASEAVAHAKYVQAVSKGLLKIFSKMGISTVQSYFGAQIFEAVGLGQELVDRWFGGIVSPIGGLNIRELGEETLRRHKGALEKLEHGGEIHYRRNGEFHAWNPETISTLQRAARANDAQTYREFARLANEENKRASTLRGLMEFQFAPVPLSLEQVEPASAIVKRFTTGAMSLGAISREAHETLAIAMNRIGAKSNTGEGGEDERRFVPMENGDSANSYIKQIASARFGVTAHFLANAREIQIKMAQGAKPGEGGQLPGHKVDEYIARLRHATPGVQLISPPPHHDIYSIEDLAQLIFDLRNSNPEAAISVKLVSEAGVGTVAAGVAKAHADKILISGDTGGTGASPLSSIKYAGLPWELGLAEAHQTLLLNHLRERVRLEADGGLRTGRDVVIAALLGADEYGFATAPLIVEGCIMMRKCHLNTCPVGIATQDPALRQKFSGKPEHVVNYLFHVAEEARELMASLGFRTMAEMIGHADRLKMALQAPGAKAEKLDLSPLFHIPGQDEPHPDQTAEICGRGVDSLTQKLLASCGPAMERGEKIVLHSLVHNVDRAVGTLISSRVSRKFGSAGLPEDTIALKFKGSAGQSFGAFLCRGITLDLEGEANDYVGKGLSGGKIIIYSPIDAAFAAESSVLIGNTTLYGATAGEAYFSGSAGERFAVRNSGALAVVEGVGDHGCEYMTGGVVVVLGPTGKNFAAGMSGGMAYVLDDIADYSTGRRGDFLSRCNPGLVEISRLSEKEDEAVVLRALHNHLKYTGSEKAHRILDSWMAYRERFFKVLPTDYKRVLEQKARRKSPERTEGVLHA